MKDIQGGRRRAMLSMNSANVASSDCRRSTTPATTRCLLFDTWHSCPSLSTVSLSPAAICCAAESYHKVPHIHSRLLFNQYHNRQNVDCLTVLWPLTFSRPIFHEFYQATVHWRNWITTKLWSKNILLSLLQLDLTSGKQQNIINGWNHKTFWNKCSSKKKIQL